MSKTQKELAFLRDLYIDDEWTRRFTDLVDEHISFSDKRRFLYINAGTGNHALALRTKIKKDTESFATVENKDVLSIARDKAAAVRAEIDFSMNSFKEAEFDAVLADASFVRPADLEEFVKEAVRVAEPAGTVAFFTVSAGSFGEIFSLLWEVFFSEDLGEHGTMAEKLITEIPTVSQIEQIAENAGLKDIKTHASSEIFEYENSAKFVDSPLISDFLLPVWLKSLNKKEKKQAVNKLVQLINAEEGTMSFRFSVKATLIIGEK